ncbi:hypothetical protein E2562_015524 [Oryza meyeriana var. granulata]|uniref:Bowman-Birk serine protease inhibitors family domain-containing protein n=1 Tax=Oryza meyeriana var. granulata TaxID=110450 RepID=A0A6G1CQ88_9ORYZ|nr:hypothetical protein E2562_015524 [Oryza meyeriana var. granulata]
MVIDKKVAVILAAQLLLIMAAAAAADVSRAAVGGGDLASKLGIRRLLQQDASCIPNYSGCCTNCNNWPFSYFDINWDGCCDPENFVCGLDFITGSGSGNFETCMPRCHQPMLDPPPCP